MSPFNEGTRENKSFGIKRLCLYKSSVAEMPGVSPGQRVLTCWMVRPQLYKFDPALIHVVLFIHMSFHSQDKFPCRDDKACW